MNEVGMSKHEMSPDSRGLYIVKTARVQHQLLFVSVPRLQRSPFDLTLKASNHGIFIYFRQIHQLPANRSKAGSAGCDAKHHEMKM
jgi:hypothetical protein